MNGFKTSIIVLIFTVILAPSIFAESAIWTDSKGNRFFVGTTQGHVMEEIFSVHRLGNRDSALGLYNNAGRWFIPDEVPRIFVDAANAGWLYVGVYFWDGDNNIIIYQVDINPMELFGMYQENGRGDWKKLDNDWASNHILNLIN